MRTEHKYSKLERTTYLFTKQEILDALCQKHQIKLTRSYEFDFLDENDDEESSPKPWGLKYAAELVVRHEKPDDPSS
jgi:hypothetical protein